MAIALSRRRALLLGTAAGVAGLSACSGPVLSPSVESDDAFSTLATDWLKIYTRQRPSTATGLGEHAFDAELDDASEAGRQSAADEIRTVQTRLSAIERSSLSRDNQVDAVMLEEHLNGQLFSHDDLQDWRWDPLRYSEAAGSALYSLMARDFGPVQERLLSAKARLEKLPAFLNQTETTLIVERVPEVHARTYLGQIEGVAAIIRDLIEPRASLLGADDAARLRSAAETAKSALDAHKAWIDSTLVPSASGTFRIGSALFEAKLKLALSASVSSDDLKRQAMTDIDTVRAEMFDIARTALAAKDPASRLRADPSPEQKDAAIRAALELAYAERPSRDDLFASAARTLETTTRFVRERDLVTLPDSPVKVIEMPEFQQGVAVAYCDSPGPLDRHLDTFYAVSPIPASWPEDRAGSFLREYNSRSIDELTIHEAMPGHYVQLWHANRHPSVLRAVLGSGTFIEGWACYAEDMMSEVRDTPGDPLRKLITLKWRLRSISNAALDHGIHVEDWDEAAAMAFMTGVALQEESEARGKWTRARVSSTQLSTYYVGWREHHALRQEARRIWGGDFNLKRYHDTALSHGSPPARLVRALMFNETIA
jgi:uncharacterized protein (DUF885 family)